MALLYTHRMTHFVHAQRDTYTHMRHIIIRGPGRNAVSGGYNVYYNDNNNNKRSRRARPVWQPFVTYISYYYIMRPPMCRCLSRAQARHDDK